MLIPQPRSFGVTSWGPDDVVLTGAYWGWSGLLFAAMWLPFFPTKWVVVPVLLSLTVAIGTRFRLRVTPDHMYLKISFLGIVVSREVFATETASVEYGFDWDRIAPSDVLVGGQSIGDETNAIPLLNTIMAAIAHVRGDDETKLAHLRLATPVTDAPKKDPVQVEEAAEAIKRYQKLGLEVLMVRGWKLDTAQRITLYVVSEKCIRVFDAYILTEEIPELEALQPTLAHDDEMAFTTRRRFVWTSAPFRLWQGGTPIAKLYPNTFWTIKGGEIPREKVLSVRGWLSEGWLKMGVDVETKDGKTPLVAGFNSGPVLDIFYDGIDLMFDVEWVESISRMLASELEIPCIEENLS